LTIRGPVNFSKGLCFVELVISLFGWLVSHYVIKYGDVDY